MPQLPAAAEPRHSSGGAGGVARAAADLPPWHRQKVKVPRRIWGSGRYSPGAVAYYAQVAALAQRCEGCTASVATLARYMGDAKRTAERYLAELAAPGPDGAPELFTVRRTGSDGDGETAERRVRPAGRTEHFAYVPVTAAKALRHPLFVLYCALTYATATRTPVTAAELAELLDVTERSARRMTDELEALGWITVHRRAGAHGRHAYEVHDHPLRPVAEQPDRPDTDGGSGAGGDGGSLAIKEDAGLTDEMTGAGGAFRRRRGDRKWVAPPVDTAGNHVPDTFRPAPGPRPADSDPVTLDPRVWAVLEPVQDLLPGLRPFVLRRIAREVARQLDTGVLAEDITDQLRLLRAWTPHEDLRDPGRWILGAALPARPGPCGLTDCVRGFMRHTGAPCKACADHRTRPNPAEAPSPAPAPPRHPATPPRATPYARPSAPPPSRIGPPPDPGGWRALVARERPHDAARTYRHRWTGDHAHLLPPDTA
ncbi:HTH domain-containing protein [Streptomyces sp.]|uniref:HTH domain-containing protein n=1 Tax=Streptomyces sp. TaxID=1931 RepID=UPI0028122815|nr:HTH domain-containing protein [Streptomyces sp.]